MVEPGVKRGFVDAVKDGIRAASQAVISGALPPLIEGSEHIIRLIDERIARIERRFFRKLQAFALIAVGSSLLVLALVFFLVNTLAWSPAAACAAVGVLLVVAGLLTQFVTFTKPEQ